MSHLDQTPNKKYHFAAVVLAGGKSLRMQKDKRFLAFGQQDLLTHCISKLQKQTPLVLVNTNTALSSCALPCVADTMGGKAGPLDGIASSLLWLRNNQPDCHYLLCVPVDCPFYPDDFGEQLWQKRQNKNLVIASSAGRQHYTCSLWAISLLDTIQAFLDQGGRAVKAFIRDQDYVEVDFPFTRVDPFLNINEPKDYEHALSLFMD